MAERRQLEFFLLRYVPDAVKGEFVNFGLLTVENGDHGSELVDVRFTKDRGRILCLDPQADLELLGRLQDEIRQETGTSRDRAVLLRRIEDSFSGVVQISSAMPALTAETTQAEIESVARAFLEVPKLRRIREPAGRLKIFGTMRDEFEKAGVLPLLNAVPAEPYTKAGDPFEFDFGYRVRDEIKLFHAVSMRASVDAAVLLSARYATIMPSMAQLTEAVPFLTAVVEDAVDEGRSEINFALEMMEESKIRVVGTLKMPEIAEVARVELGV